MVEIRYGSGKNAYVLDEDWQAIVEDALKYRVLSQFWGEPDSHDRYLLDDLYRASINITGVIGENLESKVAITKVLKTLCRDYSDSKSKISQERRLASKMKEREPLSIYEVDKIITELDFSVKINDKLNLWVG